LKVFLSGCCVCFAMVFKCFQVFLRVFQTHVSSVSSVFRRTFQMLHLDVSKVDRVLHMLQWDPPTAAPASAARAAAEQTHKMDGHEQTSRVGPTSEFFVFLALF
jgi:hypothetical protein